MKMIDVPDYVWKVTCCPNCHTGWSSQPKEDDMEIICPSCNMRFPVKSGIPLLSINPEKERGKDKNDITERQKEFYEDIAFPNYDDCDTPALLMEKARKGVFAESINNSIPMGAMVLDIGCGTGQLTNYLGMNYKRAIGCDISNTSLELGKSFRDRYQIYNANFIQANIFNLPFKKESFELVICTGVLHHTKNAYEGFKKILKLVKPGGYILIGLYNTYGRLVTRIRQHIFRITGFRPKYLDYFARNKLMEGLKLRAWLLDQYNNPHETTHTIRELLAWYKESGVKPLTGVPLLGKGETLNVNVDIFKPKELGNGFEHLLVQLSWIFTLSAEGGLFVITGRKEDRRGCKLK